MSKLFIFFARNASPFPDFSFGVVQILLQTLLILVMSNQTNYLWILFGLVFSTINISLILFTFVLNTIVLYETRLKNRIPRKKSKTL